MCRICVCVSVCDVCARVCVCDVRACDVCACLRVCVWHVCLCVCVYMLVVRSGGMCIRKSSISHMLNLECVWHEGFEEECVCCGEGGMNSGRGWGVQDAGRSCLME